MGGPLTWWTLSGRVLKISVRMAKTLDSIKHRLASRFSIVDKELRSFAPERKTCFDCASQIQEPFLDSLVPRLAGLPLISLPTSLPDQEAEVVVEDEVPVVVREVPDLLQEPVVAVVGAPGHGKSSVANLILGEERFQVRGRNVLVEDRIQVCSSSYPYIQCPTQSLQVEVGRCGRQEVTVIESPGLCPEELTRSSLLDLEQELRQLGAVSHVVVVWYALELRYSDLDFVLQAIHSVWGSALLPHLLFAVTYCDPGRKAKAYRCIQGDFKSTLNVSSGLREG